MSSKHFSSKSANVKLAQKHKPLARAIALALMAVPVAVPATVPVALPATVIGTVAVPTTGLGANITGTAFYDLTGKRTCTIPVESRIVYYRVNGGTPSYVRTDQTGKYQISTSASPVELTIDTPSEEVLTSPASGNFNVSSNAANLDFVFSVPDFQNIAPTVKLGTVATSVNVNTSVNFTATFSDSDGNGLCATNPPKWDFGDGTTANGLTASHTYAKAGTYTAIFTVTDEYGAQGQAQTKITVNEPAKPQMQISTSKVDFGQSIVGTRGYQSVTVSNTGNAPLQVGKVQMAGNTSDFGVPSDSCSNKTLAPSSQCTMQVYSQPTATGQRGATVTVPSNSSSSPTGYVTLAASGMVLKATNGISDCTATATVDSMPVGTYYPDSSNPPNWIQKGTTDSVASLPDNYSAEVFIPLGSIIPANTVLKLKNLCNLGTLQGKAETSGGVKIYTDGFITNYGTINGGAAGLSCKNGGDVVLVSTKFENLASYGKAGDTWWSSKVGGNPIENYGQIHGGDGGKCTSPATAKGGNAIVLGRNVINGNADSPNAEIKGGLGKGGDGGLTQVWGKLGGSGYLRSQGSIQGGDGSGKGGNLWLVSLPSVFLNGANNSGDRTKHHAGCGGSKTYDSIQKKCTGAVGGVDGWVRIEPNSISITDTDISGGDVVIYGGNDWTLDLHNLNGVITSTGDITLAVGQGGVVDLTENTQPVLKADGKVIIYADTIILNEGVKLEDVIQATQIVKQPSKILRSVSLTGANTVVGKAGDTIPLLVKLANNSPESDTFTLTVSNPNGWQLTQLPAQIELPQLEVIELPLEVTLSSLQGASSEITVTATSQSDPTVVATMQVQAAVEKPVVVEPEKVAFTLTKSGEGTLTAQGIDCGTDCTEDYVLNTEVKLTATPANGYQFANWSGDCASDTVTMDKAKNCVANFTMQRYTATGKVLAETNMPLPGATVKIGDNTTTTDAHGNWQIDGLTNGNYTATVTKNGYTIPTQNVVVNGENLTFDLGVVYSVYGTIKDEQKQPVAAVTITIGDQHTQTDATGNWQLDGLPAGESTLIASKDGYKFAPVKFVLGDQEPNKELLVTPASTLVMTAKPSPWQAIRQGANVTYTYTLFNGGVSTATGVTFTETVPKGAKLVTLTAKDGGECDAQTLTCTLPDLTAGATAQVELVLQATDGNSLKNTATVTANEYPADVQTSYKAVKPHLSVTVTDSPDPVVMLTDLHYTATVELSPLAPETTAKDINLVMQLPKGLELKAVTPAAGTCDSSQFPLISCQLPDLSIATPDSISQTAVNVDVTLKDAGFLVLTNEAKVTASNYPAHTVREKTNIFIPDTIKIDMVLVIDTTNSMSPEQGGLKSALTKLITDVPAGQRPTMALIEFKDDVRVKAFTQDTDVMLGAVAKLVAEGGGTCPEASAEALEVALKHLKDGGTILLATDASPYPEANLENLATLIKSKNMKFNALITGDCSSEGDWNEMTK